MLTGSEGCGLPLWTTGTALAGRRIDECFTGRGKTNALYRGTTSTTIDSRSGFKVCVRTSENRRSLHYASLRPG